MCPAFEKIVTPRMLSQVFLIITKSNYFGLDRD